MTRLKFAALALPVTIAAGYAGIAAAQSGSIDLPPGTLIANGTREQFRIVQCGLDHAFLSYKECSVEIYREGVLLGGGLRRYPAEQMLKELNNEREAKGLKPLNADQASGRAPYPERAATAARPAATVPGTGGGRPWIPPTANVRTNPAPAARPAAGGQCPRTPYVTVPGSRPVSPAILRQVMESGHTFQRAAYLWTGVTFEAFSVGAPIKNKITMRPGVGPERVTDAAPVDTALYPVRATYVLCHQYASGPERMRIQTGNYCYVSRSGNWACGTDSDVARYVARPIG